MENRLWKPVGKGLSHRFSNRFLQTETNGLALRHRFRLPLVLVGKTNWYHAGSLFGTGWSFQPVPMIFSSFFAKSSFICYIYYYLFFYYC